MRGSQVVIPSSLQDKIQKELHTGHFGIVRMKNLARNHCWWTYINKNNENLVRNCYNCNMCRNNPPKVEKHIWEPPTQAMERVQVDFAGPFMGHMFFIMIDAYTKWPEIHIVN